MVRSGDSAVSLAASGSKSLHFMHALLVRCIKHLILSINNFFGKHFWLAYTGLGVNSI